MDDVVTIFVHSRWMYPVRIGSPSLWLEEPVKLQEKWMTNRAHYKANGHDTCVFVVIVSGCQTGHDLGRLPADNSTHLRRAHLRAPGVDRRLNGRHRIRYHGLHVLSDGKCGVIESVTMVFMCCLTVSVASSNPLPWCSCAV